MPGRACPGVHVQGDTFAALLTQLADAARLLRQDPDHREALDELDHAVRERRQLIAPTRTVVVGQTPRPA
ncbi:DUF6959 family protein [Micromonospora parva]|uniref:DUF6959 family protein n=1 Tax=Micromonospora parva TaxID=1464048 RepID=UPI0036572EED